MEDEKPPAAPGQTPPPGEDPRTSEEKPPLSSMGWPPRACHQDTPDRGQRSRDLPSSCTVWLPSLTLLFSLPPPPSLVPTLLLPAPFPFSPLCLFFPPSHFLLPFLPLLPLLCDSSAHQVLNSCQRVSPNPFSFLDFPNPAHRCLLCPAPRPSFISAFPSTCHSL